MNKLTEKTLAKKYLQELASDIMLKLSDEEIDSILKVEQSIRQKFGKVTKIDTSNVTPLFYPLEAPRQFLRDDSTAYLVDQKAVLENAPSTKDDFVTIVKVVK